MYRVVGDIPLFEGALNVQIFIDLIKECPNWDFFIKLIFSGLCQPDFPG
jgi:hypothetical protein